jgi:hypothetical protein
MAHQRKSQSEKVAPAVAAQKKVAPDLQNSEHAVDYHREDPEDPDPG